SIDGPRRDLFRCLAPGGAPPEDLDDGSIEALARAGVLVDPEDAARRAEAWAAARREAGEAFRGRGYAVLRGMIPPAMVAGLRRYYRDLVAEGYVGLDASARIRYCAHNEPMARFIHRALTGLVSEAAGEPVRPSYVYFASYRPSARLDPHRDRAQCPISISMLIDYDPDPDDL